MDDVGSYRPRVARRQTRLAIRGFDYAVHEWGEAGLPLLVYLHGWGDCGATFQFVVDEFKLDWHVVAPDFRGFGDTRGVTSAYWFPDYLADLDRLLALYSPTAPVRLVGHSMGGNVAGLYAGSAPGRVAAFANLEGFGLADSNPEDAPRRYRDWLDASRTLTGFPAYPDFAALARHIAKRNPHMTADRARFAAECWGMLEGGAVRLKADPLHKLPNPVLYRRAESEACWRNVDAPTLIVAGALSDIRAAVETAAGSLHAAMVAPRATVELLPDCGHMLHFEAPGRLAASLEAFFSQTL